MAITVTHSPSAASLGGVARQAGLGQYSKFMQQMIEQRNTRVQRERMQKAQIEAQRQRDLQYQEFQRGMDELNFGQGIAMSQLAQSQRQELQDRDYTRNAWQNAVGSINNWDHWTPQQKQQFQGIQKDLEGIMRNQGLRPQEKAEAVRQGIARLDAIRSMVVPKGKSQADQWAQEGKGVGQTWVENGGKYTRDSNGNVKVLVKPITLQEMESISKQAMENTMKRDSYGNDVKASLREREFEENRLLDKWYKARGMDEMMSTYGQEFDVNGETFIDMERVGASQNQFAPEQQPQEQGSVGDRFIRALGGDPETVNRALDQAMEIGKNYPKAADAIGMTADNTLSYPKEIVAMLPQIEQEIEYIAASGSTKRARELRRTIQKIQAIMQGR